MVEVVRGNLTIRFSDSNSDSWKLATLQRNELIDLRSTFQLTVVWVGARRGATVSRGLFVVTARISPILGKIRTRWVPALASAVAAAKSSVNLT